jgi:YD repeat-containing protein
MEIGTFSPRRESGTQTCTNQYDDLTRLVSNNCGSAWSQTFTYDAFGNISKSGTASFQPTCNLTTNRYNTIPGAAPAYDADGNVTADGFHNSAVAPFGEWYPGLQADSFFTGIGQSADAGDTRFFPARNYHTTEGRWLTPDPAGLAAVNLSTER